MLDKPLESGRTRRLELKARERVLGVKSELLEQVQFTEYEKQLLNIFWTIRRQQPTGFGGPNPISYTETDSYIRRMNQPLDAWEVDTIMAMDRAFIDELMK